MKKEYAKFFSLTHGLYAQYFSSLDETALREFGEGIEEELAALRVTASRLFQMASEQERDWENEMRLLDAFGKQCRAIASLMRAKKIIHDLSGESSRANQEALWGNGESREGEEEG